ncbi:beta-ketoacyl synthase N-terminal-like domain-containing protein [Actinomadura chokoriensis]|uniref:Beta-ketoacyl synthase N-terminal-like domain-containing protein n=1 Tax=Actinomadura chokoriensis TaxID=454156 RepID=A0ABV4QZF6_9ACTN
MTGSDGTEGIDDIAIVGMSGRFPGAADLAEYWRNLRAGVESITFFDADGPAGAGVPAAPSGPSDYVPAGAELDAVDQFDADFFGYTAREAQMIDPQQRILLETAWAAVEDAGYDPGQCDLEIGVFAGTSTSSAYLGNVYANMERGAAIGGDNPGLGVEVCHAATRVSFKLGLRGPSLAVQTACSTGLVAVHLACQSLLAYECDLAVCGASAYKSSPGTGYLAPEGSVLSPDGHCRPFDAKANGTLFGSGAGVVVLRRLEDALAAGDTVHAVVKGSAVNNDGSLKPTYTAPSAAGQADVVAAALANAGVGAETIGYVEAHGTGTPLGDPIEVQALTQAFARCGGGASRCALGSVKSNFGHLDAAAGIAGLLKVVLSLRHEELPPTLHFSQPNPEIDFASGPFHVQGALRPWAQSDGPRRAGVSAFGFGGTNAHVVLEEAPRPAAGDTADPHRGSRLLVLSARTEQALESATDRLAAHLRAQPQDLADVAFTLARGRRPFPWRRAVVASDPGSAADALESRRPAACVSGTVTRQPQDVVFLYTGQGLQYPGMGRDLYECEPEFRRTIDECAAVLDPIVGWDLRAQLFADPGDEEAARRLRRTEIAQPAIVALEIALTRLWRAWGITPQAMLGHSCGEYAAACVAGVFTLPDVLELVAERGRLMQAQRPGAMLSVAADRDTVRSLLPDGLHLAAHNGPLDCVVSGDTAAVDAFAAAVSARGLIARPVATSHAFHSASMEPMVKEFVAAVAAVPRRAPRIPFASNVTGTWITRDEAQDPHYWGDHLLSTVEFAAGVRTVAEEPRAALLEIGPGQALSSLARRIVSGSGGRTVVSSLPHAADRRGALETMQRALGTLWTAGFDADWEGYFGHAPARRVPLPSYPFERRRYWLDLLPASDPGDRLAEPHPLLDRTLVQTMGETVFLTELSPDRDWVLAEHRLLGRGIVPGTAYLEVARAAGSRHAGRPVTEIFDVDFSGPLHVADGERRRLHTKIQEDGDGTLTFTVVSRKAEAGGWVEHARGRLGTGELAAVSPREGMEALIARHKVCTVDVGRRQDEHEYMLFGPRWRDSLRTVHVGVGMAVAPFELRPEFAREDAGCVLHPALVDLVTGIHALAVLGPDAPAVLRGAEDEGGLLHLPVGYDGISVRGAMPARGFAVVRPHPGHDQSGQVRKIDVLVYDESGAAAVEIRGFSTKLVADPSGFARRLERHAGYHTLRWAPLDAPGASRALPDRVLVVHDNPGLADGLGEALRARGIQVVEARLSEIWHADAEDEYRVPPSEEGFTRLLAALGEPMPDQIAYVAGEAEPDAADGLDVLAGQLDRGVHGLFALAKVLGGRSDAPDRLTVVAPRAARVSGADAFAPAPVHAALTGLTKVIDQEVNGMRGRFVDAPADGSPIELCAELLADGRPGHVALRGGRHFVPELVPLQVDDRRAGAVDTAGAVLITGGLGGLGLQVALRLAATRPGVPLLLVGRSAVPPRERWPEIARGPDTRERAKILALQQMEAHGARVRCHSADVADEVAMAAVIGSARAEFGRVACVVHAAGVAGDGFLFRKARDVFVNTMRPKVVGARVLDRVTAGDPPDLMVLFGSTVSLLGAAGQGDYAAANGYLAGYGEYRNALGLATTTIDWTDWLETGMAVANGVRRDQGFFRSIGVAEGLDRLEEILEAGVPHVIVGELNHDRLRSLGDRFLDERHGTAPISLSPEVRESIKAVSGAAPATVPGPAETAAAVRLAGRENGAYTATERRLAEVWGRELGLSELNVFDNSFDLGGNSLMALRIAQNIQRSTGVRVGLAELFQYVTIGELAEYVDSRNEEK